MFYRVRGEEEEEEYNKTIVMLEYIQKKNNYILYICVCVVGGNNDVCVYLFTAPSHNDCQNSIPMYVFFIRFYYFTSPTLVPLIDHRSCIHCITIRIFFFKTLLHILYGYPYSRLVIKLRTTKKPAVSTQTPEFTSKNPDFSL